MAIYIVYTFLAFLYNNIPICILTLDHLCFQNINGFVGLILVGGEI